MSVWLAHFGTHVFAEHPFVIALFCFTPVSPAGTPKKECPYAERDAETRKRVLCAKCAKKCHGRNKAGADEVNEIFHNNFNS